MDFPTAVKTCLLKKYFCFDGRASRSEYWYFHLGLFLAFLVLVGGVYNINEGVGDVFHAILFIATFLPALGVSIRRLHDINKSGWWVLIQLIPLIGVIWMIILCATRGTEGNNLYGSDPLLQGPKNRLIYS